MKRWPKLIFAISPAISLAIGIVAFALSLNSASQAAPGDLDPTFGSGFGRVIFSVSAQYDSPAATKRLPDGKRLIVGVCDQTASTSTHSSALCAVRLNDDGSVDTSYGTNGRSIVPFLSSIAGNFVTYTRDILLDAAGRVIVSGRCTENNVSSDMCLTRLNANGTLDTNFATSGFARASFPSYYIQSARLFLAGNARILVAGYCVPTINSNQSAFCSLRYNADGTLDTSYGVAGLHIGFLAFNSDSYDAALLPDGKLLLAGRCRANDLIGTPYQFCMQRLLQDGGVDTSFGAGGQVFTTVAGGQGFVSEPYVSVHPDGLITLISSRCDQASPETRRYCLVRYAPNGSVITTQGVNVYLLPYFTNLTMPRFAISGVVLQADGKYLLLGYCATNDLSSSDFCLVRLHTDGSFDTTFAGSGYLQTSISVNATIGSIDRPAVADLEADGRLTVVGTCVGAGSGDEDEAYDFCAARYNLGSFNGSYCELDLDGDGSLIAATDGLINLRVMLGMTGSAVVQDVPFLPNAKRTTWTALRKYLTDQCGMTLGA